MHWSEGPLALFDLETTGTDPQSDRIVTAAVVMDEPGCLPQIQDWLVDPGVEIPEGASKIHGVTTEQARSEGVAASIGVAQIVEALLSAVRSGVPVVGHNVVYDLTMLRAECARHGLAEQAEAVAGVRPVIDTIVLDRVVDPYRPKNPTSRRPDPARCGSRTLVDTCRIWGVELSAEDAHGAAADAQAAGMLARVLAGSRPELLVPNAQELHDRQVGWKRAQAEDFGRWLVSKGKVDDVSREWPVA
ncbi:exonuclease domain-containing protein [Austwickia chelonae]|uniref:exonuclease domain-containing protein n=1 Tax=Austwickia chelonae TaxID=100225 RepID=UPI000E26ABBA|nr:exonuclease domain-containing protein [Austwickia chelonae]